MGNYVSINSKKAKEKQLEAIKRQIEDENNKELLFGLLVILASVIAIGTGVILVIGF